MRGKHWLENNSAKENRKGTYEYKGQSPNNVGLPLFNGHSFILLSEWKGMYNTLFPWLHMKIIIQEIGKQWKINYSSDIVSTHTR